MDREPTAKKARVVPEEQETAITYPVQLEHAAPSNAGWYRESLRNPERFWGDLARQRLRWVKEFDTVMDCEMSSGSHQWFIGGKINVSGAEMHWGLISMHSDSRSSVDTLIFANLCFDLAQITVLIAMLSRIQTELLSSGKKTSQTNMRMSPTSMYA